jgi:hypothetical protein
MKFLRFAALAGVICFAASMGGGRACAQATVTRGGETHKISELQAAELLVQNEQWKDAKTVLGDLRKQHPDDPEVLFLLGSVAMAQNDPAEAIRLFRQILVRHPNAVRVRLELGRAFFVRKDYDNAERQFRLTLAGDLPPAARDNVQRLLYAIRLARRWSYNVSLALAPDTDINAGPSVGAVDIFGLPFQLSQQTRRQSGVGVSISAGGEWSPRLSERFWARVGGAINSTDYSQGLFDDTTVSTYAGLRFISGRWEISPLGTYFRRWYGGQFYNQGAGASLQTTYYATSRIALNGSVSAQYVDYASLLPGQSGPSASASAAALYTLTPASFFSGQVSVARQWAQLPAYANTAFEVQFGYYRDLPEGFSVSAQPSWARIDYDGRLAAFATKRVDDLLTMQATVLNRRFNIAGFTPRFIYTYTYNNSDLPLYAYRRQRFEIGLTRVF